MKNFLSSTTWLAWLAWKIILRFHWKTAILWAKTAHYRLFFCQKSPTNSTWCSDKLLLDILPCNILPRPGTCHPTCWSYWKPYFVLKTVLLKWKINRVRCRRAGCLIFFNITAWNRQPLITITPNYTQCFDYFSTKFSCLWNNF